MTEIITYPDPRLRQKAEPVGEITPEVRERALSMIPLMNASDGIGLGAPQIGWPVRIVVVKLPGAPGDPWRDVILVNPRILRSGGGRMTAAEGCLSIPGAQAPVERDFEVDLVAQDLDGKAVFFYEQWWAARIVQHELDHLDGRLFIDRLTPERRAEIEPRLRELEAGGPRSNPPRD